MERFDAAGDPGDLDEAVSPAQGGGREYRAGVAAPPAVAEQPGGRAAGPLRDDGHRLRPRRGSRGGGAGGARGRRSCEATDALPEGILVSGLGSALGARYAARGDEADLDRAIDLAAAAVTRIPAGSEAATFAASRRNNLAALLRRRYEARGDVADLEAAARYLREPAARHATGQHRHGPVAGGLARALRDAHAITGDARLLEDAIRGYQQALAVVGPSGARPRDLPGQPRHGAARPVRAVGRHRRRGRVRPAPAPGQGGDSGRFQCTRRGAEQPRRGALEPVRAPAGRPARGTRRLRASGGDHRSRGHPTSRPTWTTSRTR